ncbi:hypothetical protein KY290_010500 [Solanum tuberosum]|uniref:Uncharacterized protein n=1 Tax=Solanum tuberosum TaxID=4113 RepID=A0ABQ7VXY3_SOLTU|nr:hypothetical protein KY290_010500 [Solanum tuberosum]
MDGLDWFDLPWGEACCWQFLCDVVVFLCFPRGTTVTLVAAEAGGSWISFGIRKWVGSSELRGGLGI